MAEAYDLGCFNKDIYTWFTIDSGKQPKKTQSGKNVVTGKNTKNEPVWFYQPEGNSTIGVYKNMVTKNTKKWACTI